MREFVLACYRPCARVALGAALVLPALVGLWPDTHPLRQLAAVWLAGLLSVALWGCWAVERGVGVPRFQLGFAALVFLADTGLATVLSPSFMLSLVGRYDDYGGLVPLALYLAIMVVIVGLHWERPDSLRSIALVAAATGVAAALHVGAQVVGLDGDWRGERFPNGGTVRFPPGPLHNSNFSGAYLAICLPFVVYAAATARERVDRLILAGVVTLVVVCLWATQTRGGMLAAVAGLGTFALVCREALPRWSRRVILAGFAVGLAVTVVALWHPGMRRPPALLAQAHLFETDTLSDRWDSWRASWRGFAANPVVGMGPDAFQLHYPRHQVDDDHEYTGTIFSGQPHNIYLEHAAEVGAVGAGAFLVLVGLALWYGYRRCRRLEGAPRLLLAAFVGSLVAYATQGLVSIDKPPLVLMAWVAVGGIATIADPRLVAARDRLAAQQPAPARRNRSRRRSTTGAEPAPAWPVRRSGSCRWPVHAAVAVALSGVTVVGVRSFLADARGQAGDHEEAVRLAPWEAVYRASAAQDAEQRAAWATSIEDKRAQLDRALHGYETALGLWPGSVPLTMEVADIHTQWALSIDPSRFAEAEWWWDRAVARAPRDPVVRQGRSRMLSAQARITQYDASSNKESRPRGR